MKVNRCMNLSLSQIRLVPDQHSLFDRLFHWISRWRLLSIDTSVFAQYFNSHQLQGSTSSILFSFVLKVLFLISFSRLCVHRLLKFFRVWWWKTGNCFSYFTLRSGSKDQEVVQIESDSTTAGVVTSCLIPTSLGSRISFAFRSPVLFF